MRVTTWKDEATLGSDLHELAERLQRARRALWRHRRQGLVAAWGVTLVAVLVIPLVPQRYEARARVQVDTQSVLKPLMSGLIVQTDADRQARVVARTVVASPSLGRLLERTDLGLPTATAAQREETLTRLLTRLKLAPEEGGVYAITYGDSEPERARRVVQALVDLFIEMGAGDKTRDARETQRFLEEQLRSYESKLLDAERRLTDFKVRHFGATGVAKEDYFLRMSVMQEGLGKLRGELRAAEQTRDVYRAELQREDPQLPADVELAAQRKGLDDLLKRLGDQHPDVVATRESIARLEAQRQTPGLERAAAGTPSNPVYQRIRGSLAEAEASVAALKGRIATEERRLGGVKALMDRAPEVEAELAQLTLEFEFARKNYDQLSTRSDSAALGAKVDDRSRPAEFRVLEPARLLPGPVFPGHMDLAWMCVALALVCAVGVPLARDQMQPVVDDGKALALASGRPVLGQLSWRPSGGAAAGSSTGKQRWAVAAIGLGWLVFLVGWLAWLRAGH